MADLTVDRGEDPFPDPPAPSFLDLPSDCLARLLSFLPPRDICRASSVCKALRVAADSDLVWEDKVPIFPADRSASKKKHLYFHVIRSQVPQRWWSDPAISQGCFLIRARQLHITWGEDARYWRWVQESESWFGEVAHLRDVCWLEIVGKVQGMMFQPGTYLVSFRIRLVNLRGFRGHPVKLSLSTSDGQRAESERCLVGDQSRCAAVAPLRSIGGSKWLELDAGNFSVGEERSLSVNVSLMEIDGGFWKQGLAVDCVKIQRVDAVSGAFI